MSFTPQELNRYSRHLSLNEIGIDGQNKLKSSSVLIVGLGGLGCPAAMYLAGAGVGRLGLIDHDRIEISNLQRQPLYATDDAGLFKTSVAAQKLKNYNPEIDVCAYSFALDSSNAMTLIESYDLVLDASDNFKTRYLVNDACFFLKKHNVFASVTQFEGRLTTFFSNGPCYRCLYPNHPEEIILNCATEGVLGPVPGFWGTLQAIEAIKLILNIGEHSIGKMHIGDLLTYSLRSILLKKNPHCPLCSKAPTITQLEDFSTTCQTPLNVTSKELRTWINENKQFILIDVREIEELNSGAIANAVSLPLSQMMNATSLLEFPALNRTGPIVVYCQSGQRSQKAARKLQNLGHSQVFNLLGGIKNFFQSV